MTSSELGSPEFQRLLRNASDEDTRKSVKSRLSKVKSLRERGSPKKSPKKKSKRRGDEEEIKEPAHVKVKSSKPKLGGKLKAPMHKLAKAHLHNPMTVISEESAN